MKIFIFTVKAECVNIHRVHHYVLIHRGQRNEFQEIKSISYNNVKNEHFIDTAV